LRSLCEPKRSSTTGHLTRNLSLSSTAAGIFALVLLIAIPAFTKTPTRQAAPPQNGQTKPGLAVTTRLVLVNVIVQDRSGNPISGLTKDDFTVLDGGQPQKLAYFAEEVNRPVAAPSTASSSSATTTATAAQPQPQTNFSNRFDERREPVNVSIILLDALNTHFQDMTYSRDKVVKFLGQLEPGDRIGLYGLADNLVMLHDITSDASSLIRTMKQSTEKENSQLVASEAANTASDSGDADFDAFVNGANQRVADFATTNRADETAAAIAAIADRVAAIPGRKNLIWISASFPFSMNLQSDMNTVAGPERREFSVEVQAAVEALNNANMAIYPVDARGLIAPASTVSTSGQMTGTGPGGAQRSNGNARRAPPPPTNVVPKNTKPLSPPAENFDTMNVLAERTGGRAFYNGNDVKSAIRQAIDESRDTYVIGYYPSHNEWNGKFREINVQTNQSGVQLHFRRGYFAFPETPMTDAQRQSTMLQAIHSTLESTDLGLDVDANPVDVPGARQIIARVTVNPARMKFNQDGDHWTDNVDVVWVVLDPSGKMVGHSSSILKLNVLQAALEKLNHDGASFSDRVDIANNAAVVRLIVRDGGTGAVGSINIPLKRLFVPAGTTAPK